jgi:TPP-dependent pyruvate/acetoin dehydrogenase alpha subunit
MLKEDLKITPQLDFKKRQSLLRVLWRSRLGDLREQSLIRQGKGWFHISGMGHEALAAFAMHMEADDYAFPYYRDCNVASVILIWHLPFMQSVIRPAVGVS